MRKSLTPRENIVLSSFACAITGGVLHGLVHHDWERAAFFGMAVTILCAILMTATHWMRRSHDN